MATDTPPTPPVDRLIANAIEAVEAFIRVQYRPAIPDPPVIHDDLPEESKEPLYRALEFQRDGILRAKKRAAAAVDSVCRALGAAGKDTAWLYKFHHQLEGFSALQTPETTVPEMWPDIKAQLRAISASNWSNEPAERETAEAKVKAAQKGVIPPAVDVEPTETPPTKWLIGWPEILSAIGENDTKEKRRQYRRLNDLRNGPIISGGRGGKSKVDKDSLIEWHNNLFLEQSQRQQADEGAKADAADQYNYGRTGTAVPAIGGSVRKRRKDKR